MLSLECSSLAHDAVSEAVRGCHVAVWVGAVLPTCTMLLGGSQELCYAAESPSGGSLNEEAKLSFPGGATTK